MNAREERPRLHTNNACVCYLALRSLARASIPTRPTAESQKSKRATRGQRRHQVMMVRHANSRVAILSTIDLIRALNRMSLHACALILRSPSLLRLVAALVVARRRRCGSCRGKWSWQVVVVEAKARSRQSQGNRKHRDTHDPAAPQTFSFLLSSFGLLVF